MDVRKQMMEAQVKGMVGMAKTLASSVGIGDLKEGDIAPGEQLDATLNEIKAHSEGPECHLTKLTANIGGRPAVLVLCVGSKPVLNT